MKKSFVENKLSNRMINITYRTTDLRIMVKSNFKIYDF